MCGAQRHSDTSRIFHCSIIFSCSFLSNFLRKPGRVARPLSHTTGKMGYASDSPRKCRLPPDTSQLPVSGSIPAAAHCWDDNASRQCGQQTTGARAHSVPWGATREHQAMLLDKMKTLEAQLQALKRSNLQILLQHGRAHVNFESAPMQPRERSGSGIPPALKAHLHPVALFDVNSKHLEPRKMRGLAEPVNSDAGRRSPSPSTPTHRPAAQPRVLNVVPNLNAPWKNRALGRDQA